MNIDDIKLQLYVDGELDQKELQEVERFIKENPSAKKKVEEYRQLNNLLFEKYKSIEQDNVPEETVNLLMREKESFFKKIFNYEIKLVNALATAAVLLVVVTISNYNFNETLKEILERKFEIKEFWKIIDENEKTHLITKGEKDKEEYSYVNIPIEGGYFLNKTVGFEYGKKEELYLKYISQQRIRWKKMKFETKEINDSLSLS